MSFVECSICVEEKNKFEFTKCIFCKNLVCDECVKNIKNKKCPFCRTHSISSFEHLLQVSFIAINSMVVSGISQDEVNRALLAAAEIIKTKFIVEDIDVDLRCVIAALGKEMDSITFYYISTPDGNKLVNIYDTEFNVDKNKKKREKKRGVKTLTVPILLERYILK